MSIHLPAIVWTSEDGENPPEVTEIMASKAPRRDLGLCSALEPWHLYTTEAVFRHWVH